MIRAFENIIVIALPIFIRISVQISSSCDAATELQLLMNLTSVTPFYPFQFAFENLYATP